MGRNEEGGVLTQKLNPIIIAIVLLLTAGIAGALVADEASADPSAQYSVELQDYKVATEKSTVATLKFKENDTAAFQSVSWTAKLVNSNGSSQSSALDKTSGSFTNADDSCEIKVTAPKTAGTYTLEVTYKEKVQVDGTTKTLDDVVAKATLKVEEPITLSLTISNKGQLAITDAPVYFYVDGVMIEDSKTTLTVEADSTATLTYKYYDKDLSSGKHTFFVIPADEAYIEGLSEADTHSFYYKQSSQDYMTYIMGVILVILLVVLVLVYRRPVKNYGKPKARR